MDTTTPDWHPIVRKAPGVEGYYLAVGGSEHCFQNWPRIGEALAQFIAGQRPNIDISSLRYERLAERLTHREDSPEHNRYAAWLRALVEADEPFAVAEVVLASFLRIATNAKIFDPPTPMQTAICDGRL